jgi:hypothetical protein
MMNIVTLIIAVAAGSTLVFGTIAIWILMGYYSARILRSFQGGVLSKGWKFICIAVPFLIFGQLATGLGSPSSATQIEMILRSAGATLSLLGGLMIVIGFRIEYKLWNPKGMKSTPAQEVAPKVETKS